MGEAFKYQSSWKTEDLFLNYYTKAEVDLLIAAFSVVFKVPIYASAPVGAVEGQEYINSGDNNLYVYYGGIWQVLHALTPPVPAVITSGQLMGLLCLTYEL
jgi:hypothetical protein